MGSLLHFNESQLSTIEEAIDMSQEIVTGYFKMSFNEWKGYRYDVKTLAYLSEVEITDEAFAQICKYTCVKKKESPTASFDLYRICLQDSNILSAVSRSPKRIRLKPLILYIVTHELSHIIRFSKYCKDFFVSPEEKEWEEAKVHTITYEMLKSVGDQSLDHVLAHFKGYRWNDISSSPFRRSPVR